MDKRSFQELPPVLGSHCILFQARAVALFDNVNVLVKAITLLFTQISTVLWKIIHVWPQKVQFDWYSSLELAETLQ